MPPYLLQVNPITISPNQTSGMVTMDGVPENTYRIAVYDVLGNLELEVPAPHAWNIKLDLSKLSRGTYYIRLESAESVSTKKIALQ